MVLVYYCILLNFMYGMLFLTILNGILYVIILPSIGRYTLKFGNSINTPYPIGIDVSKSGDILIGDSHGNHFHVVVFNSAGKMLQDYRCTSHKVWYLMTLGKLQIVTCFLILGLTMHWTEDKHRWICDYDVTSK